jgi:ribosomal protein L3 glutamine methyltransferase
MDPEPLQSLTVNECINQIAQKLAAANLHYGHGAIDAQSEALWLVSKQINLSPTEALDHLEDSITAHGLQN